MSVINSQPLIGASGNQGVAGYNLTKSLRTRASASAYLNRTPASAGNRQTFTYSTWIKRGAIGVDSTILSAGNNRFVVKFSSADNGAIRIYEYNGSTFDSQLITTALFRDPSAWYHFVLVADTTQATASNRIKVYINGTQLTSFSTANYPSQNFSLFWNSANANYISAESGNANFYDGYLTEVNFVDGQALTPADFGETSATTGVWIPKRYAGTYGTNGFYLPFTNTASTSTLGNDFSGNGNTWTVNNVSLTAGTTYDSMTDVPTLTSATAANYCVLNPLINSNGVLSNGNLTYAGTAAGNKPVTLTGGFKQYAEITIGSGTASVFGLATATADMTQNTGLTTNGLYGIYDNTSGFYLFSNGTTVTNIGGQTSAGVVFQLAYDAPNGKLWIGKNNTWYNSSLGTTGNPSAGTNETLSSLPTDLRMFVGTGNFSTTYNVNFGQQPFTYTPPTGFVALNTFNLPTPTIGATASTQASSYMDVVTYTGTGTASGNTLSVTTKPNADFMWVKQRDTTNTASHVLSDVVRGNLKVLRSNGTDEENSGNVDPLLYDGIQNLGTTSPQMYRGSSGTYNGTNGNGKSYVGWTWKANGTGSSNTAGTITSTVSANTSAGFSIVTYTGNGTTGTQTVGHGLGVAPKLVLVKNRDEAYPFTWYYNFKDGSWDYLFLDSTGTGGNADEAAPSSTIFNLAAVAGGLPYLNNNTRKYVAYCFAEVAGYSKFGSYTGNGSTDGTFVYTGFRPKFIMIKRVSGGSGSWAMYDTSRDTFNVSSKELAANEGSSEYNRTEANMDIVSNGFKLRNTDGWHNGSGDYIYMAFAESPFKYANAR